jgi:hypothetical protein
MRPIDMAYRDRWGNFLAWWWGRVVLTCARRKGGIMSKYAMISGEGTTGTIEVIDTDHRGIMARLRRETCGGDRWAWAVKMLPGETPAEAIGRGRSIGPRIDASDFEPGL